MSKYDLLKDPAIHEKLKQRLEAKVLKTDSCWFFGGAHKTGYGTMTYQNKETTGRGGVQFYAHVLALIFYKSIYPKKGYCSCHRCGVKNCINPEHLYQGTYQENTADYIRAKTFAPLTSAS